MVQYSNPSMLFLLLCHLVFRVMRQQIISHVFDWVLRLVLLLSQGRQSLQHQWDYSLVQIRSNWQCVQLVLHRLSYDVEVLRSCYFSGMQVIFYINYIP